MTRRFLSAMASVAFVAATVYVAAPGQGRGGRGGAGAAPQTAQAAATNDLTGYWVRIVDRRLALAYGCPGKRKCR